MKKTKYCTGCSYQPKKICGVVVPERGGSGSVHYVQIADNRCKK